jgi:hypothetical protein
VISPSFRQASATIATSSIAWDGNVPRLVVARCDAADVPALLRFRWRFEPTRGGVVTTIGRSQVKATSILCLSWPGVVLANGDPLDLRRENLTRYRPAGPRSTCTPYYSAGGWSVIRTVNRVRYSTRFRDEEAAQRFAALVANTPPEMIAALFAERRRVRGFRPTRVHHVEACGYLATGRRGELTHAA